MYVYCSTCVGDHGGTICSFPLHYHFPSLGPTSPVPLLLPSTAPIPCRCCPPPISLLLNSIPSNSVQLSIPPISAVVSPPPSCPYHFPIPDPYSLLLNPNPSHSLQLPILPISAVVPPPCCYPYHFTIATSIFSLLILPISLLCSSPLHNNLLNNLL